MRTLVVALLVAGCTWSGGEQGSGKPKTETRTVPAFSQVRLEGSLVADISVGSQLVEINGDDNIVPLIATEVAGDRLRIWPSKAVAPKLDLTARVVSPTLTGIALSGSAGVKVHGVAGDAFAIDTSGTARVIASGAAKHLTIHVSGSATIDATELKAEDVTVELSGSGDIDVYATGVLDVHISGSGTVRYAGTPRDIKKDISGAGTVVAR